MRQGLCMKDLQLVPTLAGSWRPPQARRKQPLAPVALQAGSTRSLLSMRMLGAGSQFVTGELARGDVHIARCYSLRCARLPPARRAGVPLVQGTTTLMTCRHVRLPSAGGHGCLGNQQRQQPPRWMGRHRVTSGWRTQQQQQRRLLQTEEAGQGGARRTPTPAPRPQPALALTGPLSARLPRSRKRWYASTR